MINPSRGALVIGIGTALVLAGPATAQEQPTYTVTPTIGLYLPATDLVSEQTVEQPGTGVGATASFGHDPALAFGVRVDRSITSKLALELELVYAGSDVEISGPRTGGRPPLSGNFDAHVFAGSVSALFEVFRAPFTPFGIYILGGLGLVSRGGDFFDVGGNFFGELDGGTDAAFILGTGFRYGLSPRFGVRIDVRDYLTPYSQTLGSAGLDSSELQSDLLISGALDIAIF